MLIESKIKRKGGSPISLPLDGANINYLFAPTEEEPYGPHVCEVANADHIAMLLAIREGFKIATGNKGVSTNSEADDLVEIEAGEFLTFQVFKGGVISISAMAGFGLEMVDQHPLSIEARVKAAVDSLKSSTKAPAPAKVTASEAPVVSGGAAQTITTTRPKGEAPKSILTGAGKIAEQAPAEKPADEGTAAADDEKKAPALEDLDDADLRAMVKDVTGRAPKADTKRETMIEAIRAAEKS